MDGPASPSGSAQSGIGEEIFGAFDGATGRQTAKGLLDFLRDAGLKIGLRERVAAGALIAERIARDPSVTRLADLRSSLAPLLARSPREREDFFRIFDAVAGHPASEAPEPTGGERPPHANAGDRSKKAKNWLRAWVASAALVLVVATGAGIWFWTRAEAPTATPAPVAVEPVPSAPVTPTPPRQTPQASTATTDYANASLDRVVAAARDFDGAPTLDELSRALAAHSPVGWSASAYAERLQELTGLPRQQPLSLTGVADKAAVELVRSRAGFDDFEQARTLSPDVRAGAEGSLRSGSPLVRLARAIARIENPGLEGSPSDYLPGAQARSKANPNPLEDQFPAEAIAEGLDHAFMDGSPPLPHDRNDAVRIVRALPGVGTTYSDDTIARAMAISADPRVFSDAPWLHAADPEGVTRAPQWAQWATPTLPLVLIVFWLLNSLVLRKAYLRRRAPMFPPLHMDLLSDAATTLQSAGALFRRIGQRLQRRTGAISDRLDADATVRATIGAGGLVVEPRFAQTRGAPDYLVLIEKRGGADQNFERLRAMVSRLKDMLALDIYTYQADPATLEPDGGGPAVPIERLVAAYPNHRLLILGSGLEFLDPVARKPLPGAALLTHWTRRALLTPVPLAEWAQEEFLLAQELALPIGRATPEGLLALAELLRLEGAEGEELLDPSGDGLARPLPDVLRLQPQRYLYNAPPEDHSPEQIIQDLRNYLDAPGFAWLCAAAVYPALQWDLTLYLGVSLAETPGGNPRTEPMYREDRIGALTQLPWLREGRMPNWLRHALIETMPAARADEVRRVLQTLIAAARSTDDPVQDASIRIRIGKEPIKERSDPDRLFEDEVLLDFMAKGRIEDFELPTARFLDRFLPEAFMRRFGWLEAMAAAVAIAYAAAAFLLTPSPADGALATGAWLPLVVLGMGVLLIAGVANAGAVYVAARKTIESIAPAALALGGVLGTLWVLVDATDVSVPDELVIAIASIVWVPATRWFARRLGLYPPLGARGWLRRVVEFAAVAVIASVAWVLIRDDALAPIVSIALFAVGPVIFVLGVLSGRFAPERIGFPRALSASRPWSAATVSVLALIPVGLAALVAQHLAATHMTVEPGAQRPAEGELLATTDDGRFFATGGADGVVRVFSAAEPSRPQGTIHVPGGRIVSLAIRADRDGSLRVAVAPYAGSVKIYGPRAKLLRDTALVSAGVPAQVVLGPNGAWAVTTEDAEGVSTVTTDKGAVTLPPGAVASVIASAGPGTFAIGTLDGRIGLIAPPADANGVELRMGRAPIVPLIRPEEQFQVPGRGAATLSPDGIAFATYGAQDNDKTISLWDANTGILLRRISTPLRPKAVSFTPDGTKIAFTSWGSTRATMLDARTGSILLAVETSDDVAGLAVASDGSSVATITGDGLVQIWDARAGKEMLRLEPGSSGVDWFGAGVAFSRDGTRVVSTSGPKAYVWDARSGARLTTFIGHTDNIFAAIFSLDGTRIVTSSLDTTVRVWSAVTGQQLFVLSGLLRVDGFSSDGKRLLTDSDDNTVRVWDAGTGRQLFALPPFASQPQAFWSRDGKHIATWDGATLAWWDANGPGYTPGQGIRSLHVDEASGRITAVDTAGAILSGQIRDGRIATLAFVNADPRLALGPPVSRQVPAPSASGLTGPIRDSFVQSAIKSCVTTAQKDPANANSPVVAITQYCTCYSNAMADRIRPEEIATINAQMAADPAAAQSALQSRVDEVVTACGNLWPPIRRLLNQSANPSSQQTRAPATSPPSAAPPRTSQEQPPPPPPVAQSIAPAPAPALPQPPQALAPQAPATIYIVFFDYMSSSLTAEADAVVEEAVKGLRGRVTNCTIKGHVDSAELAEGSEKGHGALSLRRANAFRNDMIRLGWSDGLTVQGMAFNDPLIRTNPNVREPQNRRAALECTAAIATQGVR